MLLRHTALPRRLCALALCAILATLHAEEPAADTVVAVSVAKVLRTTLRSAVTAYGIVETAPEGGANRPAGGAQLAAAASGLVVAVPGIEGGRVEKGAVIVQLDSRAADAAVIRAKASVDAAAKALARQVRLSAADGTSERAMQEAGERAAAAQSELASAELQQSQLAICAPLAGVIARLRARPGEWLEAGQEVGEILDATRLVITTQVPSAESGSLRTGQHAQIFTRLGADPEPVADAVVDFISPQVAAGLDTVTVRLALPAASGLHPGRFLAARIVTEERSNRLAVPRESVYTDHDGQSTLSIVEGDVARQKIVKVGLRDGSLVEVEGEGVMEGATVVTLGSYALPKETKIRVLPAGTEGAR